MMGLERMGYAEKRGYLRLYYNVVVLRGSEQVVRAAGPATQRNPAPPFFRRKDKGQPISLLHYFRKHIELGGWMWYDMDSIRGPAYLARLPILFYGEKEGKEVWAFMSCCKHHPSRAPSHDTRKKFFKTRLKNSI